MTRFGSQYLTQLLIIFAVSSISLCLPKAGYASQAQAQAKAAQKALQDRGVADMTLVAHLAMEPQLMNTDYLDCYLGPKDNSATSPSSQFNRAAAPATVTTWHDNYGHYAAYKLDTSLQSRNDYAAEFSAVISEKAGLRLKDVDKILNLKAQSSFDEKGQPVEIYTVRPDTKLLVYRAPRIEDINKMRICYAGGMLPLPSADDMREARQYRRDTAMAYQKAANYAQATTLLKAHLRNSPDDAEAHLMLADSYKAQCHINEAISEYRIALDRSGDDDDLRKRCVAGLRALKINVPDENPENSLLSTPVNNPNMIPGLSSGGPAGPAFPARSPQRININNDVGF